MTAYGLRLAEKRIRELERQVAEVRSFLANEAESQDWTRPPWIEEPNAAAVQVVVRCDIDAARAVLGRFVSITAPGLGVAEGLLSAAMDLRDGAVNLRLECDRDAYRFFRSLRGESYGFNFTPDTGLTLTPIPAHPADVPL